MKTAALRDFRRRLTDHLANAVNGEPVTVTRYGKPEAALVPINDGRIPPLINALDAMRLTVGTESDQEDVLACVGTVLAAYEEFREDLWTIMTGEAAP